MRYFSLLLIAIVALLLFNNCSDNDKGECNEMGVIPERTQKKVVRILTEKHGEEYSFRINTGVKQAASFWMEQDGDDAEFEKFCEENFVADKETLDKNFVRLQKNFEVITGHFNRVVLDLNEPLHLDKYEILPIDMIFGAYNPAAHLQNDFYKNKLAFFILLNFPHYTLEEKNDLGQSWSRKDWAYARMGDIFTSRVPSVVLQNISKAMTEADAYISDYNIYVGHMQDNDGKSYFDKDKKLITHWNLRDEIKSKYSEATGLPAQQIIYEAMKRIITQEIPEKVINSNEYEWNPYTNTVYKDGSQVEFTPEPNTRYQHLLTNYHTRIAADPYNPYYPTYIQRTFREGTQIPQEEVEALFVKLVSSPIVKDIAGLIKERLGRDLQPFDIWYDGFKARSTISQDILDNATKSKYPDKDTFYADLPNILVKLGFPPEKANSIVSHIQVDASRGAGHAWGAEMKSEKSRLRTRIGADGMDYKGYNIAVHEFGHNVEQTLTLQDVDYYMMRGVPNTAFTELWAFVFQARDLDLLGINDDNPDKEYLTILDNFWSVYEIMGVSLVDMHVWKWLYDNPNATPEQLKNKVIEIAKDIWNKYFAEAFGIKDEPILAIYSHMIDYPLYLSAYPLGHLAEFQVEKQMEGKSIGEEMIRICTQGNLTPNIWMEKATGSHLSADPIIEAAEEAVKELKK
jgi:hypothetical protein